MLREPSVNIPKHMFCKQWPTSQLCSGSNKPLSNQYYRRVYLSCHPEKIAYEKSPKTLFDQVKKLEVEAIFLENHTPVLCVFIGGYAFLFVC